MNESTFGKANLNEANLNESGRQSIEAGQLRLVGELDPTDREENRHEGPSEESYKGSHEGSHEDSLSDLPEALDRAARQVEDIQRRLEMARSAAAGEELEIDELDRLTRGFDSKEEARRHRSRELARSVAKQLGETLHRFREALQETTS